MTEKDALYPIREISRLTGVSPITLRAWERRYALIEPVRTDTGHRLYTQSHIDFINQAVELTKQGIPISKVKSVLEEREQSKKVARTGVDVDYENEILVACAQLNLAEIELLLEQAFVNLLEQQVYTMIVNVSLELLNKDLPSLVLWRSVVVPILASRTYQGRKSLKKGPLKKAYVVCDTNYTPDLKQLIANQAIQAGYNPLIGGFETAQDSAQLLDIITKLHCEVLLVSVVDLNQDRLNYWQSWAEQHKSIETIIISANEHKDALQQSLNFKLVTYQATSYFE